MNEEELLAALELCRKVECEKCEGVKFCNIYMRMLLKGALDLIEWLTAVNDGGDIND